MKEKDIVDNRIVSVIIPVFQAEKYVSRCVASVTKQTYDKLEIILMDDGSTDNSLNICHELAQKDSRIKVFHHENMGVAATRNKGLDCASGQFIYFVDSDDWIDENTLSDMVSALEENHADLCICGFKYIEGDCEEEHCVPMNEQMNIDAFMDEFFWKLYEATILFNIGTKLYRRSTIEENRLRFSTDMIIYEDIRFFLDYINKVQRVALCRKPYYNYFQGNSESITHVYKKDFWESTSNYCNILVNRFDNDSYSLKKAVLICLYRAYLQECRNPEIKKAEFCQTLKEICFPIAEKLNLRNSRISELSLDQKMFMGMISWKALSLLWILAVAVSLKDKK